LVVKPVDGNHGRGITTRIQNFDQALRAFRNAQRISNHVIIEKYIPGNDYRFLVINYKLVAAAKRTAPAITGDGILTIRQLVDQINTDSRRGYGHEKILTKIEITSETVSILNDLGWILTAYFRLVKP
jgi:cyanophycin synthetase